MMGSSGVVRGYEMGMEEVESLWQFVPCLPAAAPATVVSWWWGSFHWRDTQSRDPQASAHRTLARISFYFYFSADHVISAQGSVGECCKGR